MTPPSDHGFSSSPASSKPPAFRKFSPSGEADENDPNHGEMAPKKSLMKHFMSPTISAASKAAVPRKKILAERNEASNFSGSQLHYSPDLDSRTLPSDSSSKPYDPLTNYLSPRPKFLRYNPSRRHEIFLRQEDEEKDGFGVNTTVSFDSHGAVVQDILPDEADSSWVLASQEEDSMKQEDEISGEDDVSDSDEEIEELEEEEEEEKHSIFKGLMKLLLVIGILFTSTLHISFMNSPSSPGLKAVQDQNHTFDVICRGRSGSYIRKEWIQEVTVEDVYDHHQMGEAKEVVEQFLGAETGKFEDDDGDHPGMEESGEIKNVVDHSLEKTGADSDPFKGIEYEKDATIETGKFEDNDDAENGEIEYVDDHSLAESGLDSDQLKGVETSHSDRSSEEENEANGFSSFKDEATKDEDGVETMELDIENTEFCKMSSDPSFDDRFLVVSMIIAAASALGFLFCRKKHSVSTRNPPPKSSEAEKIISEEPVLPNVEELIEKVESFVKPPRPIRRPTEEEDSGDFNQTGAPAVELIGEFVVEKVSERVKRMKIEESQDSVSREKGWRRSNEAAADAAVSGQAQLSVSELSAVKSSSSPPSASYGSFIAGKEIVKKKEDGEARTAVRTPVRRSSRISNRAVLSP
ncbi:uncharacterized protein LOC127794083 [Diospyros lotus]|uniref:uncharacterized protein LOC127794083 n=1 Tax=Diospyros lotus TaxID=55363 RepID=UPI0022577316|nr:uncharacterized protein LOC127794083 [Diospyros lotus]